ncbi:E3 ubiquitin-protein ligase RNF123-like [Protobothrops mucrosquamatus]|uniref:E3 ubiquitin-protein ligase RNF123-like n=1 Tax=Protobothrops mucrosquamatus TaxID=103944 RepID=UPI000775A524|nr:E3 ubiquitin-protein ligase RNF123-like [Protobothrops mucrosquamatus]
MTSRSSGTAFPRKNYRLSTESEKSKIAGIVNGKLLNDYLHRIFPSADGTQPSAACRKHLSFQNLQEHIEQLLAESASSEDGQDQTVDGRLGPSTVVLDHTSGFEGLLLVDDDLLGVIGHSNFGSIRATTCVYKGKWIYEVLVSSQGLMQIGWCTLNCRFNQEVMLQHCIHSIATLSKYY